MVLICVAAILCIAAFNGMKKGAIRMAASLVAMIITIAVTTFVRLDYLQFCDNQS